MYMLDLVKIPVKVFPNDTFIQFTLFKIRRPFRRSLRNIEKSSMITSSRYLKVTKAEQSNSMMLNYL